MLSYLKVIHEILKPNGRWIHLGPLLYHFEGNPHSDSVEYTRDEFLDMVESFGFVIQEMKQSSSVYASCPQSMSEFVYHSLHFIAQKQDM